MDTQPAATHVGRPADKVFDAVASMPWAITPEYLQVILSIAARRNLEPELVAAQIGQPLDNTRKVRVRDGVAIIPVTGPIFRYANVFTRVSGATSIETLAQDFTTALNDETVTSILLQVDSPGGQVPGVSEFAQMIYAERGQKPMTAYIDGTGCSAAYWIASACDRVVVSDTALVGSIGVIAAFEPDPYGEKPIEIVSSQSPKKAVDPETPSGRAQIQATLDRLATVFIDSVALYRGVTSETVLADFGQGDVFVGTDAVAPGLVDAPGTFEDVVAALAAGQDPAPPVTVTDTEDDAPALPPMDPIEMDAPASRPTSPPTRSSAPHSHPRRKITMKFPEWIRTKAREDGVEDVDDYEFEAALGKKDEAPAAGKTDESAPLRLIVERQEAELAALRQTQQTQQAALAAAAEEKLRASAASYVDRLVATHRIVPAAADALVPLVMHIASTDTDPTSEGSPTQLLQQFAANLPDLSAFTTQHVDPSKAAALFPKTTTEGVDGKPSAPNADAVAAILAATDMGKQVLAEKRASNGAAATK
jgi:ClpP class serine protease